MLTASITLTLGSAAAYALARLRVPGSNKILLAVLATQMFPGIVIAIPHTNRMGVFLQRAADSPGAMVGPVQGALVARRGRAR